MTLHEHILDKLQRFGPESLNKEQHAHYSLGEIALIYAFGGIEGLLTKDNGFVLEDCLPALDSFGHSELSRTLRSFIGLRGQTNFDEATAIFDQFNCWTLLEELEEKHAAELLV